MASISVKKVRKLIKNQANLLIFVGLFAIVGVAILIISTAATPSFSVEPESGQLSGSASQITDSTASGGKAIKFGDAVVTPPTGGLTPPPGSGWSYVGGDEFDGTSLSATNWKAYDNNYGAGNKELGCNKPANVTVSGGSLKITAKKETLTCPGAGTYNYTSGFIGSKEVNKFYPAFGWYESRARVPHGQGMWPAFWLRHRNGSSTAEVDIMEYFHSQVPGKISQTLHFPNELSSNYLHVNNSFEPVQQGTGGWHTWAVNIEPVNGDTSQAKFTFYLNGVAVANKTPTKFGWLNNYDKNAMFDIAVNMAIGGNWVGHPEQQLGVLPNVGQCSKGGTYPDACSTTGIQFGQFPALYEVDYVRVWKK